MKNDIQNFMLSIFIIFLTTEIYKCEEKIKNPINLGKCIFMISDSAILNFNNLKSLNDENK